jgi:hypothetical protein
MLDELDGALLDEEDDTYGEELAALDDDIIDAEELIALEDEEVA